MDETRPHDPRDPSRPGGGRRPGEPDDLSGISEIFGLGPGPTGDDPLVGSDLGGVTIVRLIAEGGMGRVYEGRQHKPDRTVAVKVMRPGIASAALLRRFEYEAQVLGRLTHPGIAQIYTVGMHTLRGEPVPYFVMEFIPGARTITQYATELNLTTQERLELFRKVCDAVAHGHHKGVIHRDLKPGNILVDAAGQPRVIDFGVARSTGADMALTTIHTAVGQLLGTVQYMSPEQFNADPDDIDTRADVYALGVVLYELLAGKPPYDIRRKAIFEAARVVREEDPTPISSLNKTLKRAIGDIALKCLEKDRVRRYSSAGDLGADIGRYLAGERVVAGSPSFFDGVSRLVRRHKGAAIVSAAVVLSVLVATLGIAAFAAQAARQRALAIVERERAVSLEREARQEKARADAQSIATRERRYAANLHQLDKLLDEDGGEAAQILLKETRALVGESAPLPIELCCLEASFDGALATLAATGSRSPWFVVSPDAQRVAAGAAGRALSLVDAETGRDVRLQIGDAATQLAFGTDNRLIGVARDDATVTVVDNATGQSVVAIQLASLAPTAGATIALEELALAPDGKTIVAVVQDERRGLHLGLWSIGDGALVASATVKDAYHAFAFSPDGSQLLVALGPMENRGGARLIDTRTGAGRDIDGWCTGGYFHPSGDRFLVLGGTGGSRLVDAATCATIAELPAHTAMISRAAFTPDGTKVLTAGGDARIHVCDARTGAALAHWEWNPKAHAIALSPDGSLVAAAAHKGGATVWNLESTSRVADVLPAGRDVCCLAFGPQPGRLALGGRGGSVRIWDVRTNSQIAALRGHTGRIRSMAFAAGGERLVTAAADGSVRLWDATRTMTTTIAFEESKRAVAIAYSPDGKILATGCIDGTSCLWDAATLERLATFPEGGTAIAFTHDGTGFAAASRIAGAPPVTIYDVASRTPRLVLPETAGAVPFMDTAGLHHDLLTVASGGRLCLWDMETGRLRVEMKMPAKEVASTSSNAVASSPDGKWIAVGSGDGIVRIWDTATGAELPHDKAHTQWVIGLRFNTDGSRLLSSSIDGTARLWDMPSAKSTAVVPGGGPSVLGWLDRERFAIGTFGGAVLLGHAGSADQPAALQKHTNRIIAIAFDPAGRRFGTVSLDHSVRIWDAASGDIALTLPDQDGLATSLAFSPDGRRVAAIVEGTVVIWGMTNGEWNRARLAANPP